MNGVSLRQVGNLFIRVPTPRFSIAMAWLIFVAAGCSEAQHSPARWQAAFRERVRGADALEIVIRRDCEDETEVARFQLAGEAEVKALVALIEIQHYEGKYVSLCGGKDTLTFSRGTEPLVKLMRTPLTALTWDDPAWKGDAVIRRESYRQIATWLKGRGFAHLSDELTAAEEASKKHQAENEAFVSDFPPEVCELILKAERTNGRIDTPDVLRQMASSRDVFRAVSRSLGRLKESDAWWTSTVPLTRAVLSLAQAADASQFWAAAESLSDDPIGQLGAARLYFYEKIGSSPARSDPWPLQSMLAVRVLTEGADENKLPVIRHLGGCREPEAVQLLHKIAQGAVGTGFDLQKTWNDEPDLRFLALLALAQRGEKIADEEWNECSERAGRPQDRAALEIAGNLIGKHFEIRMDHFRFQSYALGDAGIAALVRSPGPRSLGLLVEGAMEHPWAAVGDDAERAVERIIGQSWERKDRRRKIDEWLAANPRAWIRPGTESP
jgi:hypothetical protein